MTTYEARAALDRAREAWERTQAQLILDERPEYEHRVAAAFAHLRLATTPDLHPFLDQLERTVLSESEASARALAGTLDRLALDHGAAHTGTDGPAASPPGAPTARGDEGHIFRCTVDESGGLA